MTPARASCLLILLAILGWGCTPVSVVPDDEPKEEQPAADTEAATSFAGVWKRPDSGAAFKVEDDGEVVTGKLEKGTWMWVEEGYDPEELFERFEFKLERSGEALKGKATFRFVGDSKDYESAWEVTLSGEELKATVEELEIDDEGKVASTAKVEKTFAFEPAVPRAPPTVAHGASDGGYQMDLTKMIKGPPMVPLGEGVEIGFKVEIETQTAGHVLKHFLAVVGEEGESWRLESSEGLAAFGAKDSIMGLVVEKSSGKVTRAVIGKAGEAGKELAIHAMPETPPAAPGAEGEDVDVEVPAGEFPSRLTVTKAGGQEYKSWVGREGDLEGVLLKFEGPDGKGKALQSEPETQSLDLGETVEARRCVYDNGDEIWNSSDEVVKALAGGIVRYKAGGVVRELKSVSSKAEPQLTWE